MKISRKILLSMGAVSSAASIAGLGTFATFTDSESANHQVTSGTVNIALGAAGADNRMSVAASGLVPGDTIQRRVKLSSTGSGDAFTVTLTTSATTSSVLDTDATDGLQMKIEKCSGTVGWTESGSTPYTYTCDLAVAGDNSGTRSTVLARRAVVGSALSLSNLSATTPGGADDMVVTIDLPSSAGNGFQGKTSTIQYTFNATQRSPASK